MNEVKMRLLTLLLSLAAFVVSSYFTFSLMKLFFPAAIAVAVTVIINIAEVTALLIYIHLRESTSAAYLSLIFSIALAIISVLSSTLSWTAGNARNELAAERVNAIKNNAALTDSARAGMLAVARKQAEMGFYRSSRATLNAFAALPSSPGMDAVGLGEMESATVENTFRFLASGINTSGEKLKFSLNLFIALVIEFSLLFFTYISATQFKTFGLVELFERSSEKGSTGLNKKDSTGLNKKTQTSLNEKVQTSLNKKPSTSLNDFDSTSLNQTNKFSLNQSEIETLKDEYRRSGKSDAAIRFLWEKGLRNKSEIGRIAGAILKGKRKVISSTYVARVIGGEHE